MGALYELKQKVDATIAARKLNPSETKGQLSLRSGVLLALVGPSTPDDPAKIERLRAAMKAVLGLQV